MEKNNIYDVAEEISVSSNDCVPIWHKALLTLEEAAKYSGIGICALRILSNKEDCSFVFWNKSKRLIKRRELDEFISKTYSI
ncbi:MAG: transposase [Clostridia bacterium]|nr:transposase [Clostridia bacterium]MBR4050852.1 transposase [Clostridia bacterium]